MTVDHLLSFTENEKRKTMKWLVLLAFLAIAAAELSTEERTDVFVRKLSRMFDVTEEDVQNCIKTTNTTLEDVLYAINYENDDMDRFKRISCLAACCAKKKGMMVGMKLSPPVVLEHFTKNHPPIPPEDIKKFSDSLTACNEEVTETENECSAMYQLGVCIVNKSIHKSHPRLL
ncbi:uncharacterized protein LOC116430607 [Nomia melanderi]|uniref:uncharacterized protein LOC116430607 n=1 Tax=Nomia melanderi TaxID=2448451 RepID=UPI00130450D4|nr:uncharacterized protein LOC116430607 [Nomia melanderi]